MNKTRVILIALIAIALSGTVTVGCSSQADEEFLWLQNMSDVLRKEKSAISTAEIILTNLGVALEQKVAELEGDESPSPMTHMAIDMSYKELAEAAVEIQQKTAVHNTKVRLYNERALAFEWKAFMEREDIPPHSFDKIL